MEDKAPGNKALLMRYAGMAFQFLLMIGLAVWLGWFFDGKINTGFPLLIWLLPLVVIISLISKAITDTKNKK